MSEEHITCKYLYYVEHLLILVSTVTGGVSISALASLKIKNLCNYCRNPKANYQVLISKFFIDSYISHSELKDEIKWNEEKNFCGIHYINMVNISRDMYERNDIEAVVDKVKILCLNEQHKEEGLDQKNLWEITSKYHSDHWKHRYEIVNKPKNAIEF